MTVLTRYLLRAHIGPFCFALVALTGILVVNTVLRDLADLQGRGLPGAVVMEFLLLSLPPVLAMTLPMSVLVAVLYAVSQMAADNEITALRASGVDLRRVALPLVLAGGLLAGGMSWFNDRVLPATNHRLYLLMVDIFRTTPLLAFRENAVNPIETPEGSAFLRASRIEAGSGRMRDVTLVDAREANVSRTIYADSGRLALTPGRTDLVLSLYDGHMRRLDFGQPAHFERIHFGRYLLTLSGVARGLERSEDGARNDRTMTIAMMRGRIAEARSEAAADPGVLEWRRAEIRGLEVEIHKKYSIAAASLIFVLIGIPLALRFRSGGITTVIAVALPVFALFYMGLEGGESLARAGHLSPMAAMWLVNAVMAVAGTVALLRVGREEYGRG